MSEREQYPAGVPCWVDTLQPDPQEALDFYASLADPQGATFSISQLTHVPPRAAVRGA